MGLITNKEIDRLRFAINYNTLELKYSNNQDEINFHKDDYVIKLKGTSVFSKENQNMLSVIRIEEKGKDLIIFNGMWVYTDYISRQNKNKVNKWFKNHSLAQSSITVSKINEQIKARIRNISRLNTSFQSDSISFPHFKITRTKLVELMKSQNIIKDDYEFTQDENFKGKLCI